MNRSERGTWEKGGSSEKKICSRSRKDELRAREDTGSRGIDD